MLLPRSTLTLPSIAFGAMLGILYACSPSARVVPVAVVAWPKTIRPECEIPEVPAVPDLRAFEAPNSPGLERIYVSQRQVGDMVAWQKDVKQWADQVNKCLGKLTQEPR